MSNDKAGYNIAKIEGTEITVNVGDTPYTFDLSNQAVVTNLLERGVKRYMDAAKAGKDGADVSKALNAAAKAMSEGKIGRGSFDVEAFGQMIEKAETLDDCTNLNKMVAAAPKKDQAALAGQVAERTIEIAMALAIPAKKK